MRRWTILDRFEVPVFMAREAEGFTVTTVNVAAPREITSRLEGCFGWVAIGLGICQPKE